MENHTGTTNTEGSTRSESRTLSTKFQRTSSPQTSEPSPRGKYQTSDSDVIPPITEYESYMGEPYSAKHFGISGYIPGQSEEIDAIYSKLGRIEQYAREQIVSRGLEDTVDGYQFIIGELRSKLGLNEFTHAYTKVEKMYDYLSKGDFNQKERDKIKKMRESLKSQLEEEKIKAQEKIKRQKAKADEELSAIKDKLLKARREKRELEQRNRKRKR